MANETIDAPALRAWGTDVNRRLSALERDADTIRSGMVTGLGLPFPIRVRRPGPPLTVEQLAAKIAANGLDYETALKNARLIKGETA